MVSEYLSDLVVSSTYWALPFALPKVLVGVVVDRSFCDGITNIVLVRHLETLKLWLSKIGGVVVLGEVRP